MHQLCRGHLPHRHRCCCPDKLHELPHGHVLHDHRPHGVAIVHAVPSRDVFEHNQPCAGRVDGLPELHCGLVLERSRGNELCELRRGNLRIDFGNGCMHVLPSRPGIVIYGIACIDDLCCVHEREVFSGQWRRLCQLLGWLVRGVFRYARVHFLPRGFVLWVLRRDGTGAMREVRSRHLRLRNRGQRLLGV